MKKIILILIVFISLGLYSQEVKNYSEFHTHNEPPVVNDTTAEKANLLTRTTGLWEGAITFVQDIDSFYYYNGIAWRNMKYAIGVAYDTIDFDAFKSIYYEDGTLSGDREVNVNFKEFDFLKMQEWLITGGQYHSLDFGEGISYSLLQRDTIKSVDTLLIYSTMRLEMLADDIEIEANDSIKFVSDQYVMFPLPSTASNTDALTIDANGVIGRGAFSEGLWTENGSDIYFNSGDVSIGATSGDSALNVIGGADIDNLLVDSISVGDLNFTGTLYENGVPFVSGYWTQSGSDIYYNTGAVTIGGTSPTATYELDVVGDALIQGDLNVEDSIKGNNLLIERDAHTGDLFVLYDSELGTGDTDITNIYGYQNHLNTLDTVTRQIYSDSSYQEAKSGNKQVFRNLRATNESSIYSSNNTWTGENQFMGDVLMMGETTDNNSFGEMSDPADVISTATANYYTLSNWTEGQVNETSLVDAGSSDSTLLINQAGTYLINFSISFNHSANSTTIHICAFNSTDNTEYTNIETEMFARYNTDTYLVSGTGLVVLAEDDEICLRGKADNTGNLTINHGNLSIIKIK